MTIHTYIHTYSTALALRLVSRLLSAASVRQASVLSAIFEDGAFRAYGDENAGGGVRWEVDTSLEFDGGGISEHSTVTILFREDSR